jgi:hypothetical protein
MNPSTLPSGSLWNLLKRFFWDWLQEKMDGLTDIGQTFSAPTPDSAGKALGRQYRRQERMEAIGKLFLARMEATRNEIARSITAAPPQAERPAASHVGPTLTIETSASPEDNPQNGEFFS